MVTKTMFSVISCIVAFALLSCSYCSALPTLTLQGCGPDEMGLQPKYRNLCVLYNGLLRQQVYDTLKSESPVNRFMADAENSPSDMMLLPPGSAESHYTNGGVKRQDVDHVFLRFGRRR